MGSLSKGPTDLDRALHASVMKREAVKEKYYSEERQRRDEEVKLGFGATNMCKEELRKVIDSDRRMYYRTEELNDKLYIHYKGWRNICGLEGWTGLRALYAECNAFDRIEGLQTCRSLRSLFLQENCIRRIEGLENCPDLYNINLSNNFIERIEGLGHLKNLNTLVLAKNRIGMAGVEDLEQLVNTSIGSLDIQDNPIWDPDVVSEVLTRMPGLRVLYLKGNPCTKKIPNYRKSVTAYCRELRYLDDRPVFEEDRRAAEAFNRGGLEEERVERRRIREEKNAAHDRNMRLFQEMVDRVKLEKREREAMRLEDKHTEETDPGLWKEREMKQRTEEWKRENAEELVDHDLERAKRMLAAENPEGGQPSEAAPCKEHPAEASVALQAKGECDEEATPKKDNRRLVYEDIWDDIDAAPAGVAPASASPAAVSGVSQADVPFSPSAKFEGAREGWYFGTGPQGTGYYADLVQADRTQVAEAAKAPSWHAEYKKNQAEHQAQLDREMFRNKREFVDARAAGLKFVPPARVLAENVTGAEASSAMDRATQNSAASELHEMD